MRRSTLLSLFLPALYLSLVDGYTFNIADTPYQCGNLSVSVSGSGGQPPYSLLVIPFGASPLPGNIEARRLVSQSFGGTSTSVTLPLKYPADSQFVMVVSDNSGFGTGGTSGAVTVQNSDNSSCFNATQNVQPDFTYAVSPGGELTECTPTRLWWVPSDVQGTPSFQGVIPGGESFQVPQGAITNNDTGGEGTGFSWTPAIRGGTTVILVAGDNRGPGTGGSVTYFVNAGTTNSCLNSTSPSSTVGNPAGGAYPTNTDGATVGGGSSGNNGSGGSVDIGAIVGGVIGGISAIVAAILVGLFFLRRRRFRQKQLNGDPVDLLQAGHDGSPSPTDRNRADGELPRWYEPEPFLVPPSSGSGPNGDSHEGGSESHAMRPSTERSTTTATTTVDGPSPASGSATGSSSTRKTASTFPLRAVNIIQHDDAGVAPSPVREEEAETVELPPAYTHIRR